MFDYFVRLIVYHRNCVGDRHFNKQHNAGKISDAGDKQYKNVGSIVGRLLEDLCNIW